MNVMTEPCKERMDFGAGKTSDSSSKYDRKLMSVECYEIFFPTNNRPYRIRCIILSISGRTVHLENGHFIVLEADLWLCDIFSQQINKY